MLVELSAANDLDVQLYDLDDTSVWTEQGQAIVAYCRGACNSGALTGPSLMRGTYADREYTYSGWNGDGRGPGHEFISIAGATNRRLSMSIYAYAAGAATVSYSYTYTYDA